MKLVSSKDMFTADFEKKTREWDQVNEYYRVINVLIKTFESIKLSSIKNGIFLEYNLNPIDGNIKTAFGFIKNHPLISHQCAIEVSEGKINDVIFTKKYFDFINDKNIMVYDETANYSKEYLVDVLVAYQEEKISTHHIKHYIKQ